MGAPEAVIVVVIVLAFVASVMPYIWIYNTNKKVNAIYEMLKNKDK